MAKQQSSYKKLRTFFLIVFLISVLVSVAIAAISLTTPLTVVRVTPSATATATAPFPDPRTATVAAVLTQAAQAQLTVTPLPTFTNTPAFHITPTPTGTLRPGETPLAITPTATATRTATPTVTQTITATTTAIPLPTKITPPPSDSNEALSLIAGPLLTAFLGLLGFVSTTMLQWRKEARDARNAELERKRLELEYEKKKRELEKSEEVKTKPKDIAQPGSLGARKEVCHLAGLKGDVAGQTYSLEDGAVIGRSSQSELHLADPSASRQHARLRFARERWFIQDMKSTGGLFVNGARVDAVALQDGDHIRVGRSEFEFREPGK